MKIRLFVGFCSMLLLGSISAQPVLSSRQLLSGFEVYKDLKDHNLYYYAPGDLALVRNDEGKPAFQLVEMRYAGSSSYGDAGNQHFRNLVQFTIEMQSMTAAQAEAIKQAIAPSKTIALRPIPIQRIESLLVTTVGENSEKRYQKVGSGGAFEETNAAAKGGYWTQRTFTLKLDNHEAQLLWGQIEKGQLALSLNYAFYVEAVEGYDGQVFSGGNLKPSGDPITLEKDSTVQVVPVKSNSFALYIDPVKWPELMKKIDINEDMPPAYAALEVKCYDLADGLRPDLFRKTIEIKAMGVGGQPVSIRTEFSRTNPDLYSRSIRFPFAVKMTQPLQYRIEEINLEGEKTIGNWITSTSWADLLDITTPNLNNSFVKSAFEVEFEPTEQATLGLELRYVYRGQGMRNVIQGSATSSIVPLTVVHDRSQPIRYRVMQTSENGAPVFGEEKVLADTYLFISSGN